MIRLFTILVQLKKFVSSYSRRQKIFCIGINRTGTTSMAAAFRSLGFKVGNQQEAERFLEDWAKRNFWPIIRYCKTAEAFQDIPFSLPYTYQALDAAFPGSKFILTIRNSADEWYDSLIRFHTQKIGKNRVPTADDLKQWHYLYKGYVWRAHQLIYGIKEDDPYEKELYIKHYKSHNRNVCDYFKYRSDSLLVLNLSNPTAMRALCSFLGIEYVSQIMPHLNASRPAETKKELYHHNKA